VAIKGQSRQKFGSGAKKMQTNGAVKTTTNDQNGGEVKGEEQALDFLDAPAMLDMEGDRYD
jgi:hypothetical protein